MRLFSSWRAALAGALWLLSSTPHAVAATPAEHAASARLGAPRLDPVLLRRAMEAVSCAERGGQPQARRLGIIDFRLPSSEARLWVFDLSTRRLLFEERVAHGRGSGDVQARLFSNVPDSYTSSLGLFRTLDTYEGANGYSLRLQGLERGVNDRAFDRQIVMHGADYVSSDFIKSAGRLGRSYGCPAVRREIARPLIDALRGDQYLYAYGNDASWKGTAVSLGCTEVDAQPAVRKTATAH